MLRCRVPRGSRYHTIFDGLDKDDDGKLDIKEFNKKCDEQHLPHDENEDGRFSFTEVLEHFGKAILKKKDERKAEIKAIMGDKGKAALLEMDSGDLVKHLMYFSLEENGSQEERATILYEFVTSGEAPSPDPSAANVPPADTAAAAPSPAPSA